MAVETTETRIEYAGTGEADVYEFPFPVLEKDHLAVTARDANGNDAGFAEGVEYATTLVRSGTGETSAARIALAGPLPPGWTIGIGRAVPLTQTVRLRNHAGFFPEAVEEALDKLTMIDQQHAAMLGRALMAPDGSDPAEAVEGILGGIAGLEDGLGAEARERADGDAALRAAADAETAARRSEDRGLRSSLDAEAAARGAADAALRAGVDAEAGARKTADAALRTALNAKADAAYADAELAKKADKTTLQGEIAARTDADAALRTALNAKVGTAYADAELAKKADKTALLAEASARAGADADLRRQTAANAAAIADLDSGTMPAAPDDGKIYVGSGGTWTPLDLTMGDPFAPDADGDAVVVERPSYLPNRVWDIRPDGIVLSEASLPGDADGMFVIDADGDAALV